MSHPFSKKARQNGPVLSREQRHRQGFAVKSALAALGVHDEVRAFLNSHHPDLKGRPIDLAVESDAGLKAVVTMLDVAAGDRPGAGT
jgi:uncharacterized protein (DUF2384 family)